MGPFRPGSGIKDSICRATGWPDCFALSSVTLNKWENAYFSFSQGKGYPVKYS